MRGWFCFKLAKETRKKNLLKKTNPLHRAWWKRWRQEEKKSFSSKLFENINDDSHNLLYSIFDFNVANEANEIKRLHQIGNEGHEGFQPMIKSLFRFLHCSFILFEIRIIDLTFVHKNHIPLKYIISFRIDFIFRFVSETFFFPFFMSLKNLNRNQKSYLLSRQLFLFSPSFTISFLYF